MTQGLPVKSEIQEAKDAVDAYIRTQPALVHTLNTSSASPIGCITWLIVLALFGAVAMYYLWRGY